MRLADRVKESGRVFIVGVAGDSGSGKTTLSSGMRRLLGEDMVSSLSLDDYHSLDRDERKIEGVTPLNPRANHLDLLAEDLAAIRSGEAIRKPVYDHSTGRITGPVPFRSAPVLIIEGLHPFYTEELRRQTDLKIFVDPSRAVKRRWKVRRDCGDRGYRPEEVMKEILEREPDYKRYVDIQKIYAEVVVKIEDSRLIPPMAEQPIERYSVRMIQEMMEVPLSEIGLTIDLSTLLRLAEHEFSISFQRDDYYGNRVGVMTIDGELHKSMIEDLEQALCSLTGRPYIPVCDRDGGEYVSAIGMAQLILCWRLLEKMVYLLES
ncbi:MAG: phosphoribulokinase [Euryarchaeota archaeon]|nr:phosphoribulokinase [Euryarchaeota archaeon]